MVFIAGSEHGSSPAPALTSVTYGGQSLSKVNDVSVGSGPTAHVEIWILDEAGVAAATDSSFVPTWSAAPDLPMYSHAFFGNVDQATPTGAQAGEATNSSTPNPLTTVALATNNGDTVVAGAVAGNDGTYTPQNGFTLGNEQIAGTTTTLGTAYIQTVGGTETPSMQHSNPNRQVIAGVVLNMSPQVPAPSLVSVTYGGQSLTKENDVSVGTTTTARVEIWILDESGITAATDSTFVPTWTAAPDFPMYSHAFLSNADQGGLTGSQDTNSTAGSTPNPITTGALGTDIGELVIAAAVAGADGTYTPQNGFTLGNEQTAGTTTTLGTAFKAATGPPETPPMLHSAPNRQVIAAVVIEATDPTPILNVALAPVASVNRAFVTWSKTPDADDGGLDRNDFTLAELTSVSNLQFRSNTGHPAHIIWWEVVEFTNAADINVQTGSTTLLGAALSTSDTIATAVDLTKTFLLVGYEAGGSGSDIGSRMIRARITDTTTVTFDRSISGSPDDVTEIFWQAIELTDGSIVQSGSESFGSGTPQVTRAISSVVTDRAVAFGSVQPVGGQNTGRSPYAGDDAIGVCSGTLAISATLLTIDRNSTVDTCDLGWFVVEFAP